MAYDNLRCLLPIKQNQPEISPASASFNGKAMAPCLISLASLDQRFVGTDPSWMLAMERL